MKKLAIISGGTKGIGRAIVKKFAQNDFDIITCSRNEEDLKALKVSVEKVYSTDLDFQVVDMSVKKEVESFNEYILRQNRHIDVLVNNVGYFAPGLITEASWDVLEKMLNTNLLSAYHLTRGLVGKMKVAATGHIFLICSVASLMSYANGGAYSVSKFAMLGLSKALRLELADFGIKVTAVIPGATRTGSWDGTALPDERFIAPKDVAESVYGAYSLSNKSVVEELIIRPQLGDI